MKTRKAIVALALLLASCKTRNENSAFPIVGVIAPTATAAGSGAAASVSCKFDPASTEFTELPYNPLENQGNIAALVQNNLTATTAVNGFLRADSTTFLPHQAVVDYEFIPNTGTAPGENIIPVSGLEVTAGSKATVGIDIFSGTTIAIPNNTLIRVTFHIEGKLLDGSLVHTSEREYLFRFCTTPGCGLRGPWAVPGGSCL